MAENKIIQAKFEAINKVLNSFAYENDCFTEEDALEFHSRLVALGYVIIKL